MFRKSYSYIILTAVIVFTAHFAAYSQFAPVDGRVVLNKDGASVPVVGASIEVYRTDIKATFPSTKTDRRGEFRFVGMPFGATYVFSVSAPNCAPVVYPGVKAGQEKLVITMDPGDGRKYTEAEARQVASNTPKPGESASDGLSDEQKKANAEIDKKNAEITAKNEKIKAGDAIATKSFQEGKAAKEAKNYDLAVAKFNEGIEAVPDYVGSTPILLSLKMEALKDKGFLVYREGVATTDPAMRKAKFEQANKSYEDGLAAFQQAVGILSRAEATTDPVEQKRRDVLKHDLYAVASEIHRLKVAGGVDLSKIEEANTVIADYMALENDPAVKVATQMGLADMMRVALDFEKAVAAYRQVLVLKADHAEATGKLGLSLFGLGVSNENKELQQEGLNYMQKYIDMAPITANDSPAEKEWKNSINDALVYLKAEKMTPQKVASPQKAPSGGKKK